MTSGLDRETVDGVDGDFEPSDGLSIALLRDQDHADYERYVSNHRKASYGHSLRWKRIVERSMDHRPAYLVAWRGATMVGVLPLFETRSLLWGTQCCSVPAANVAGILADEIEAAAGLRLAAEELARKIGAKFVQLRDYEDASFDDGKTPFDESYLTTEIDLRSSEEEILRRASRSVAQELRQAERNGLQAVFDAARFDDFYSCYGQAMRRLGTPPYSRLFFRSILDEFGEQAYLLSILHQGKVIASNLGVIFNGTLHSVVAGTYRSDSRLRPDTFFCWKSIQFAKSLDLDTYSMGRSVSGSGAADFKSRWRGRERRLRYHYLSSAGLRAPKRNPNAPFYRSARFLWRLVPRLVAERFGHQLISHIN